MPESPAVKVPESPHLHGPGMTVSTHPVRPRTTAGPAARRHSARTRLDHDWHRLRRDPDALAHVAGWEVVRFPIEDLDQLLDLTGRGRHVDPAAEAVVRRLLLLGRDDDLAARVLLQRLVPGLLALVRKWGSRHGSVGLFEELLAGAWIVVRTFDPARRPACHVAALLRGAEHQALTGALRPRRHTTLSTAPASLDRCEDEVRAVGGASTGGTSAFDTVTEVLRDARDAGLPAEDLDLLVRLATADEQSHVAAALGVTTRTVRNRRDATVDRLHALGVA